MIIIPQIQRNFIVKIEINNSDFIHTRGNKENIFREDKELTSFKYFFLEIKTQIIKNV